MQKFNFNFDKRGSIATGITWIPALIVIIILSLLCISAVSLMIGEGKFSELGKGVSSAGFPGLAVAQYNLNGIFLTNYKDVKFIVGGKEYSESATLYDYVMKHETSFGDTIYDYPLVRDEIGKLMIVLYSKLYSSVVYYDINFATLLYLIDYQNKFTWESESKPEKRNQLIKESSISFSNYISGKNYDKLSFYFGYNPYLDKESKWTN